MNLKVDQVRPVCQLPKSLCESTNEYDAEYVKAHKLFRTILRLCELAGFKIQGNITIVNTKTGRVWR